MTQRSALRLVSSLAPLAAALLLAGCPPTGVVCTEGLTNCGGECVDLRSDRANCSTCANRCQVRQVCHASQCQCQAGAVACSSECVVVASDARHCGACGHACASTEVCEQGVCKDSCRLPGVAKCGQSCVNINLDVSHCGSCDNVCENSQSCHRGYCSYDVVAACMTNGQVTGVQADSELKGPNEALGAGPAALATVEDVLLVADGIDNRMLQARLPSSGGHAFAQFPGSTPLGTVPNQVLVESPFVYVVNASTGTLQVLQLEAGPGDAGTDAGSFVPLDGGRYPQGLRLATVGELAFGANTYPEGVARLGGFLYVPLYGGFGATAAAAGQKVVKVDVSNPAAPTVADTHDLSTLDLEPFDGGTPVARPFAIAAHQGAVYVALNNLNPDTYLVEGPGLLARIDPATGAVTTVGLGTDCLNPIWLVSDGTLLYVSCQGSAQYDTNYALLSVEKTGVVALKDDVPVSTWQAACGANVDGGCLPIFASRLAVAQGRVYVGDQNGGRLFVLENNAGVLSERRGYLAPDGSGPIQACAVRATLGYSNVSDVIAVP